MKLRSMLSSIVFCDLRSLFVLSLLILVIVLNVNGGGWGQGAGFKEFPIHDTRIEDLTFSPDGKRLASVSLDGAVKLWNVPNWRDCDPIFRGSFGVYSIAFSPDGRTLAAAGSLGHLLLWKMDDHMQAKQYTISSESLYVVAFSPDGEFVATAGIDQVIRLWNVRERRIEQTFHGHTNIISDLVFTADGERLVSVGRDDRTILWNLREAKAEEEFHAECGPLRSIALSPDGRSFAVGGEEGIAVRDLISGRSRTWRSDRGEIMLVRFMPDGHTLVTMNLWGTINFLDLSHDPIESKKTLSVDHKLAKAMVVSPDGKTLLTTGGYASEFLRVWQLAPPAPNSKD